LILPKHFAANIFGLNLQISGETVSIGSALWMDEAFVSQLNSEDILLLCRVPPNTWIEVVLGRGT